MSTGAVVVILASITMVLFCMFFVGFAIFHNRKMIANHKKVQELEREKSRKNLINAIEIQEQERQRMGADIHDDLGPTMVAIKLKLSRLSEKTAPNEKDLAMLNEMVEETITNVRGLSQSMYPNTLERYGLVDAINEMAARMQSASGVSMEHEINPKVEELSELEKLSIYRIVQEFCNNSLKHSQCDHIKIDILEQGGIYTVEIKDNGNGFSQHELTNPGLGLKNMEMRSKAINFDFDLQSDSSGTKVILSSEGSLTNATKN